MEVKVLELKKFGNVRLITSEDGRVLFCGKDIAVALGYGNTNGAIKRYCTEVEECRAQDAVGRTRYMQFVSLEDVYRLMEHSKLPMASELQALLEKEMLPEPSTDEQAFDPSEDVQLLQQQLREMQPKAEYFNAVIDADLLTSLRETAKLLDMPERLFVYLLEEMQLVYRTARKRIVPTAYMINNEYADFIEYANNGHGGMQMKITPKGRLYLFRRLNRQLTQLNE